MGAKNRARATKPADAESLARHATHGQGGVFTMPELKAERARQKREREAEEERERLRRERWQREWAEREARRDGAHQRTA